MKYIQSVSSLFTEHGPILERLSKAIGDVVPQNLYQLSLFPTTGGLQVKIKNKMNYKMKTIIIKYTQENVENIIKPVLELLK